MAKEPKQKTPDPKPEGPRSFGVFLHDLASGAAEKELSRELHDLVKNMKGESRSRDSDMKGSLTLKLNFLVPPDGPAIITFDVTKKLPKRAVAKGYCWVTEGGNLTHQNPQQGKLPFRQVEDDEARDLVEDEDEAADAREV
jgi:hypothetical protein